MHEKKIDGSLSSLPSIREGARRDEIIAYDRGSMLAIQVVNEGRQVRPR
jgi:hypothetical protein